MLTGKQTVSVTSALLIIVGSILIFLWASPVGLLTGVGMIIVGITLFLLYTTFAVAGWADRLVSGEKTEISFTLDPKDVDFELGEEER